MKLTGFTDKNGKAIYDGDIIQAKQSSEKIDPVEVVWKDNESLIHAHANDVLSARHRRAEYEVIGNIYENGDLLK